METFQYEGWSFDFDKDSTRKYYATYSNDCTCASCRNFHKNIKEMPSDVKDFLERFGIDIDKPIEQMSSIVIKEDNLVEQEVSYCVKGTASSVEGYEIDIGNVQIVIHNKKRGMPNHEMTEPYFAFILFNMLFHWTVDDDINECYPERKRFIQKLKSLFFHKK